MLALLSYFLHIMRYNILPDAKVDCIKDYFIDEIFKDIN